MSASGPLVPKSQPAADIKTSSCLQHYGVTTSCCIDGSLHIAACGNHDCSGLRTDHGAAQKKTEEKCFKRISTKKILQTGREFTGKHLPSFRWIGRSRRRDSDFAPPPHDELAFVDEGRCLRSKIALKTLFNFEVRTPDITGNFRPPHSTTTFFSHVIISHTGVTHTHLHIAGVNERQPESQLLRSARLEKKGRTALLKLVRKQRSTTDCCDFGLAR